MGRIYCLMGKSASGKDSVYREILKRRPELGTYVMYTTRPMREGETDGVTYHYTDTRTINEYAAKGRLIESRTYNTVYGPWTYATVDDGQFELDKRDYLIPATLESYSKLKKYFNCAELVPLLIEVEDGERLLRAVKREMQEDVPKYTELCRRFIADSEDFSEEKIHEAGISRRYVNNSLDSCTDEIIADMEKK